MRYASVCSGVEAASLAWGKLGWTPVFFAEVEPFPCAVLQQRFNATKPLHPLDPAEAVEEKDRKMRESWMKQINKLPDTGTIPNLGDFTKIKGEDYVGAIDLLVGGTPCFPAGNLVLTDFGYKPIEDIKVGDRVISHLDRLCRVVRTGSKIADNVGIMKATNNVDDIFISATANHPFLVGNSELFDLADAEFKPIAECVGRYAARLPSNGKYTGFRIEYFEPTNQPQTVYNIEVENDHSYIVNGLCVHNCQDLSVAGKRAGFEGARSSLALDFVRLAYEARCQYFVWENVPGVFSSNRGRDFATLLSMFCGYRIEPPKSGWRSTGIVQNRRPDRYGLAWRVLDAQFTRVPGFPFAVPQRRRRVFLVGCLGDWERSASILLEPDRLSWDTPPRIKTREEVTGSVGTGSDCSSEVDTSYSVDACYYKGIDRRCATRTLVAQIFWNGEDVASTITQRVDQNRMPDKDQFHGVIVTDSRGNGDGVAVNTITGDHANRITDYTPVVTSESAIRRLTPLEVERLFCFPDNHTRISWNGKPEEECPDAPRYKAEGNSMAVNCMEWIGRRIEEFDR